MAVSYMTEDGYNKILAEINYLETVKRPEISAQIAEARDKGDLSENAEYDAAMEKAASTMDTAERSAALHEAEDVLMEQVGCIPVAYYNDFWLQSEKITGIWHSAYGYWYFMYGDIAE